MIKEKIKVLIIEDSKLYQMYLKKVIESDECLTAAGTADCGSRALEMIPSVKPDVITLDLQLPDISGLELLKEIIRRWKIPVIAVSGDAEACEKAIGIGAGDFIEKMQDAGAAGAEQFRLLLKLKIKMQAGIHSGARDHPPSGIKESPGKQSVGIIAGKTPVLKFRNAETPADEAKLRNRIIVIGASLGGTEATLQLLENLPENLPGIVIVQHLPPDFTKAYAMRLNNFCRLKVCESRDGDPVLPGSAIVAKGGSQLTVRRTKDGYCVRSGSTEKYGGFCPSMDVLFRSAAQSAGSKAIGVILTGMGQDGARGLKCMHDEGAYTLGQDKESCAVFGMPCAAWELGGVDKLLPPELIAKEIVRQCCKDIKSEADKK